MAEKENDHERPENLNADVARERLVQGNRRFVADQMNHPRSDADRRDEIVEGQSPYAAILTCSDSRVVPELIFDQGLGDLFVLRVAGNIADKTELGTVEFAASHLGINLVVVMGHGNCGAVKATVDTLDIPGAATKTHVDTLIDAIRPAVRTAKAKGDDDLLDRSVKENALAVAETIRRSEPVMASLCWKGVEVLPAYYDLENGEVRWLS
ncbi:MAG: carbonic anhydrase [Actinobacteria bacterium]|nr:MAG: carbonic anhydrase [Actinomycetota bacterium]